METWIFLLMMCRKKIDISDMLDDWKVPAIDTSAVGDVAPKNRNAPDLFGSKDRKKWHALSADDARCDLKPCIRLTKRGVFFISVWKKSLFGRTIKEMKADNSMVDVFSSAIVPVIRQVLGANLDPDQFAVICSPRRRHIDWNFGNETAAAVAKELDLHFYPDACHARSRQRVGAVFDPHNVPPQKNLIVYDDIVTTGQTLVAMQNLFSGKFNKNCIFFANINNKL